jgi:hypothetical protein
MTQIRKQQQEVVMHKRIRFTLTFIGGLLAGAVAMFLIMGQISHLQYRDYYLLGASEQAFIASELRANRERQLQDRVEAGLPSLVVAIHNYNQLRKAPQAPFVLRQIRDFYELNSLPVPAEISGILNEVPRTHR